MKVTTKGQVTIPRHIRKHLDVSPHDDVDFLVVDNRVVVRKSETRTNDIEHQLRVLRGSADISLSADEIMTQTRGEKDRDHAERFSG